MAFSLDTEAQKEVWQTMEKITAAWVENQLDLLRDLFHEDIVIVAPGMGRAEGRDICIKTFDDFVSQATIRDYRMEPFSVDVFGNAAAVMYDFDISYEMKGESYRDKGHDVFLFTKEADSWRAVWRTMIATPE